jgi:hypothetical protein
VRALATSSASALISPSETARAVASTCWLVSTTAAKRCWAAFNASSPSGAKRASAIALALAAARPFMLIKALAEEVAKARTPTVYGRPSVSPSPYGRGAQGGPLVFSRSL